MLEGFVARGGPWGGKRLLCVAAFSVSTGDEGSSLATITTKLFIADFFYLAEYNIFLHFVRTINILHGTIMYFNVNSYVRITISKFLSISKAFSSLSMFKPYN